jgi:hypothetical protein
LAQIAAATPMARPVMKQPGITRIVLCMYRSVLTQRPTTSTSELQAQSRSWVMERSSVESSPKV